jgi:hypothetical protein
MGKAYAGLDPYSLDSPGSWDSSSVRIDVEPVAMYQYAMDAKKVGEELVGHISSVVDTISVVSWVGGSQQEADDFNSRFKAVMIGLFGTEQDPESGALNKFMKAVQTAANNFDGAETGVCEWFRNSFNFDEPASGETKPRVSQSLPPITETW